VAYNLNRTGLVVFLSSDIDLETDCCSVIAVREALRDFNKACHKRGQLKTDHDFENLSG